MRRQAPLAGRLVEFATVPAVAEEELHRRVEDTKAIVRQEMPAVEAHVSWQPAVDR